QTETEATGAPQKHHYTLNQQVGSITAAAGLQVISDHTKAIISFALCGFANLSSIAILIGGLGGMAPNRRQDIAQLGLRAVAAGTLSNLMSATIAGVFLAL
ncbi:nucleoside transporter C-terminal domain-containing protein, partial [Klebsiella pneumoniae]|uniref:nucleoside transporter C-terminal domain-containing protein n=1 Tax=Klebsiella pneumoniae TaxID=573 RepID=UPI003464E11F